MCSHLKKKITVQIESKIKTTLGPSDNCLFMISWVPFQSTHKHM